MYVHSYTEHGREQSPKRTVEQTPMDQARKRTICRRFALPRDEVRGQAARRAGCVPQSHVSDASLAPGGATFALRYPEMYL